MTTSAAVGRFASGASVPATWIRGLSPADLDAFPVPGTWSIRQLVLHVLDSDLIAAHRMKRIIAESNPLLIGYDETAFAKHLGYERVDVAAACECFRLNREVMVQILRGLPAEAFDRSGVHNERGKVTLLELVHMYGDHLDHHAPFLSAKRAKLGKPI
jgi:hypothetical protein